MANIFGISVKRWYVVDANGKLMFHGYGFYDPDEAVIAANRLEETNPEKEFEVIVGGIQTVNEC